MEKYIQNDKATYIKNMKLNLEILNYQNDNTNFLVKVKHGSFVQQTPVGNNWNQTFSIDLKKSSDLKVEVWQ